MLLFTQNMERGYKKCRVLLDFTSQKENLLVIYRKADAKRSLQQRASKWKLTGTMK